MPNDDRDFVDKALQANLNRQLDRLLGRRSESSAEEEAAARRRAEALGISIETIGGNAPVQAEGYFDDKAFYFRARHDGWLLEVGPKEIPWSCDEWEIERDYGTGEDASWMPIHEAIHFICEGVVEFRAGFPGDEGK